MLSCIVKPGALIQYYYVIWYKNDEPIVELDTLEDLRQAGSRYDIDQSTFSLIINSVNTSDSSTNYLCEVFVENPLSHTYTLIRPEFDDTLTLNVNGE